MKSVQKHRKNIFSTAFIHALIILTATLLFSASNNVKIKLFEVSFSTMASGKIYAIQYGEGERAVVLARRIIDCTTVETKKSFLLDFSST